MFFSLEADRISKQETAARCVVNELGYTIVLNSKKFHLKGLNRSVSLTPYKQCNAVCIYEKLIGLQGPNFSLSRHRQLLNDKLKIFR
jgi:hypothetical protein